MPWPVEADETCLLKQVSVLNSLRVSTNSCSEGDESSFHLHEAGEVGGSGLEPTRGSGAWLLVALKRAFRRS